MTLPDGRLRLLTGRRELLARRPAFFAELTLIGRCGRQLARVLRGEVNPLQLLFPEGSVTWKT